VGDKGLTKHGMAKSSTPPPERQYLCMTTENASVGFPSRWLEHYVGQEVKPWPHKKLIAMVRCCNYDTWVAGCPVSSAHIAMGLDIGLQDGLQMLMMLIPISIATPHSEDAGPEWLRISLPI
jgi:hypothetical protein